MQQVFEPPSGYYVAVFEFIIIEVHYDTLQLWFLDRTNSVGSGVWLLQELLAKYFVWDFESSLEAKQ